MEQKFVLKECNSFEPKHIFECGQCFRWNEVEGEYIGVFADDVISVRKDGDTMTFKGVCDEDIKKVVNRYFDLDFDYECAKKELSEIDVHLKKSIVHGYGIRILNQDLWETIISFIISANNNIPRIKGIIERLSREYGRKIVWNDREYYTFPTSKELSVASVEGLRGLGLGFRDKRVYETTRMVNERKLDLEDLIRETDIEVLRNKLLTIPGVGPKVADCVMLFGLRRKEVFPIDVWVGRVMNKLYAKNETLNKKKIEQMAKEKYGNLAGLAQQYLFYGIREGAI